MFWANCHYFGFLGGGADVKLLIAMPTHLGHVLFRMSANNGTMTARILARDRPVKAMMRLELLLSYMFASRP
jgi:hypothetical protein